MAVSHWRVSLIGQFGAGAGWEQFVMTLSMGRGGTPGSLGTLPTGATAHTGPVGATNFSNGPGFDYTGAAFDILTDAQAWVRRTGTSFRSDCYLHTVKIAQLGTDGKYVADPWIATGALIGGLADGTQAPPQCALVHSLTTARRGPTGRGRIFVPWANAQLTNGVLPTASVQPMVDSFKTFITDLNNWPGSDPQTSARVVVASSKGYLSDVTGVRIGRVVDTHRSRRQALAEGYLVAAI